MLSRNVPPTGEGLRPGLTGCDVVVDASNGTAKAVDVLVDGSRRLLEVGQEVGVRQHLCVSAAGCEGISMGYFPAKARQERVVQDGKVAWTIFVQSI